MPKKLIPFVKLRQSQHDAAAFMINTPNCLICSGMGFGKTAAAITAIEKLFARKLINKLLIVSTKRVTLETWPNELKSWEHASRLKFICIAGDAEDRIKKAVSPAHIYLINQELYVWLVEKAGKKWPYDMLLFDDVSGFKRNNRITKSHRCKFDTFCPLYAPGAPFGCVHGEDCEAYTEGARRYTRFGATCALRSKIKRIVYMTGTPTSKDFLDLWPLMFILDGGKRLKRTFSDYKTAYYEPHRNGFNYILTDLGRQIIPQKIKDICIAIPSEAKLPRCFHIEHKIKLPEKAESLYKHFAKELVLSVEGEEIEAANMGVLAGKLLQICGGAVYNEDKETIKIHDAKIKAVKEIIKKHPNEPILIGYNFVHELKRLQAAFPGSVDFKKQKNLEDTWNNNKIAMGLTHPSSAGHGLNLQKGKGRVLIWFGLNWSLDLNKQLNKRLHRPGQKRDVYIYYIIVDDKADSNVMDGITKYDYSQQQLLEVVKRKSKKLINQKR